MKNLWFLSVILSSFLISCGSSENNDTPELDDNFHIEGKIQGAANTSVKIEAQTDRGTVNVAETKTDANGNYTLDGNIPSMGLYSMSIGNSESSAIIIPLNVNDQVVINGNIKTFAIYPQISGTNWAKPLMAYQKKLDEFNKLQGNCSPEELQTASNKLTFAVKQQVLKDPSNPVNVILASELFPDEQSGFGGYDQSNMDALIKMSEAFQAKYPDSPITAMLVGNVGSVEQQFEQYTASTSGTVAAPEISLPDPNGNQLRLSDLKGKVVLIDFWASWCGPCRKENPNVVRLYKKYNSKGFEIFSVSLDDKKDLWKQAIQKDGLTWKYHVSDLMGWQTPLVQQYGFNGIPYTVLLNKEGKIIGIGLRGEQLEQKLEEVLGKK